MKINLSSPNFSENYLNQLLSHRGIADLNEYLVPTGKYLQSPDALKNIHAAAAIYLRVVQATSTILLVVDSDCDGFTSAAIIYQYTKRLNPNCNIEYWLHEGKQHGLQDHIDKLLTENVSYDLIILPDSSSNDNTYHEMLKEINIPCLILDHHITDVELSDNAIVVNNQLSPTYLNKDLTGAGVVYQFCRYLDQITGTSWADDYLDLAALGVIGDMGSMLTMENRYIAFKGLTEQCLRNDFFKCLLNKQGYSITGKTVPSWREIVAKTNPISVAFYIVPLINAMIRVGTMEEKERLLLAFIDGSQMVPCNKRGAKGTLERVDIESARECTNAKNNQNKIKEAAIERLEAKIFKYDLLENKILFVRLDDNDDFPSVLNGLIATQLANKFKKPTIVARLNSENIIRGSMRGLNQSELNSFKDFLEESGLFEYVLGHPNAAGISIPNSKLDALLKYANNELKDIDFGENCYNVDFVRKGDSTDLSKLVLELGQRDDIWGQNNPQPQIYIESIPVTSIRVMGTSQNTLKIEYNGMSYIKFHAKELITTLTEIIDKQKEVKINIVGRPNLNEWGGRVTPQIFIEDCEILEKGEN